MPATIDRLQEILKKVLLLLSLVIATIHILLATFRYVIPYQEATPYLRWAGLSAVIVFVLYLLVYCANNRQAFFSQIKRRCTYEQAFLAGLLFLFIISCWINQVNTQLPFLKSLDWKLFDTAVCFFLLFPTAKLYVSFKNKSIIEFFIHIAVIPYSIFTYYALWNVFHLNVINLPSGEQAGITKDAMVMFGYHPHLTGMISATLFCLCIYMFFSHTNYIRGFYGLLAIGQLITLYLSNCRTVFLSILFFIFLISFCLSLDLLRDRQLHVRLLLSVLISVAFSVVFWYGRSLCFLLFDNISHFSEQLESEATNMVSGLGKYRIVTLSSSHPISSTHIQLTSSPQFSPIIRKITNLHGRISVWRASVRVMTSDPFTFFWGVTPIMVPEELISRGGIMMEKAHAHNSILQIGCSFGVPAMTLFVNFVVFIGIKTAHVLISGVKNGNKADYIIASIILCYFVINLTEAYLVGYFSVISCFFFLFCGWVALRYDELTDSFNSNIKNKFSKGKLILFTIVSAVTIVSLLLYSSCYLNINGRWIKGNGTKEDPYLIENEKTLSYFRDLVNRGNHFFDCYFLQTTNIDLKGQEWLPIGMYNVNDYFFAGTYDGGCHYIENLVMEHYPYMPSYVGFFGLLEGTVKNLGIESGIIKGEHIGSITSHGFGKGTLILNCYNKAKLEGVYRAGGICDNLTIGKVINCINEGSVSAGITADLVSRDASFVTALNPENAVSYLVNGEVLPLVVSGNTVEEKLNSGLRQLIEKGLINEEDVSFWSTS